MMFDPSNLSYANCTSFFSGSCHLCLYPLHCFLYLLILMVWCLIISFSLGQLTNSEGKAAETKD